MRRLSRVCCHRKVAPGLTGPHPACAWRGQQIRLIIDKMQPFSVEEAAMAVMSLLDKEKIVECLMKSIKIAEEEKKDIMRKLEEAVFDSIRTNKELESSSKLSTEENATLTAENDGLKLIIQGHETTNADSIVTIKELESSSKLSTEENATLTRENDGLKLIIQGHETTNADSIVTIKELESSSKLSTEENATLTAENDGLNLIIQGHETTNADSIVTIKELESSLQLLGTKTTNFINLIDDLVLESSLQLSTEKNETLDAAIVEILSTIEDLEMKTADSTLTTGHSHELIKDVICEIEHLESSLDVSYQELTAASAQFEAVKLDEASVAWTEEFKSQITTPMSTEKEYSNQFCQTDENTVNFSRKTKKIRGTSEPNKTRVTRSSSTH